MTETVELARVTSTMPTTYEVEDLVKLANNLYKSGLFKDAPDGYKAFAKLLFGRDLGVSATAAMTGVHIIEGKPEVSSNLQAQFVNTYVGPDGERYRHRVREHDGQHCKIEFFEREAGKDWESLGFSEYTMADAKTAGLAGKGPYQKHPRNMLFARAMSDGVAFLCPQVMNGVRTYHDHEIDVDGRVREQQQAAAVAVEIVDGEVVETPQRQPLNKRTLKTLQAAIAEADVDGNWVKKQLIAVGVEDVHDPHALEWLTDVQAKGLLRALSDEIDARDGRSIVENDAIQAEHRAD